MTNPPPLFSPETKVKSIRICGLAAGVLAARLAVTRQAPETVLTGMDIWLFGAALVAATLYFPFANAAPSWSRTTLKTIPVLLLSALSAVAEGPPLLTAGLFLSALGDLALSRPGRSAFLYGLCAFALAHVLYAFAFTALGGGVMDGFAVRPVAALAAVALAISTEVWLAPHTGGMRWLVRLYVVLILVMVLAALGLPGALWLVPLGAGLFMLSDLVLSVRLFRMADGHARAAQAGWIVWISYVAAQALIVAGVVGG